MDGGARAVGSGTKYVASLFSTVILAAFNESGYHFTKLPETGPICCPYSPFIAVIRFLSKKSALFATAKYEILVQVSVFASSLYLLKVVALDCHL
jgi:hypothetical protein